MFETSPELSAIYPAAKILAEYTEWPPLYDEWQLARNEVPMYSATYMDDMYVDFGDRKKTWGEELKTWYYSFKNYSFVFLTGDADFPSKYNSHLWSIPIGLCTNVIPVEAQLMTLQNSKAP